MAEEDVIVENAADEHGHFATQDIERPLDQSHMRQEKNLATSKDRTDK